MKAVFKKMIAVAFCAATAASMLSIGVSAANPLDQNLIEYGMYSDSKTIEFDNGYDDRYSGDVLITMSADNYHNGKVYVKVDIPRWADSYKISYDWKDAGCSKISYSDKESTTATTDSATITASGENFSARCDVTVVLYYKIGNKQMSMTETTTVSLSNKWAYESKGSADQRPDRPYYDSNYPDSTWDKDNWYWDGDGYWYWSNGSWHYTTRYPSTPSRPSYSREYEVDWSGETFYYNGKVQLPTATVTIGGRTIELDVKLISGDGKSVGTHRVRASLPRGYYNYDLTDTTLRYTIKEAQKEGFVTEDGETYYYENGKKVTGWKTIKGTDYYFLKDGTAANGWEKIGPDTYYFSDGKMVTGWINEGSTTYYCYGNGKMCHGRWHEIGGYWYYFEKSGAMSTSKWIQDGKKWYYVAGDGRMATNTTVPSGYKVGKDGAWIQ